MAYQSTVKFLFSAFKATVDLLHCIFLSKLLSSSQLVSIQPPAALAHLGITPLFSNWDASTLSSSYQPELRVSKAQLTPTRSLLPQLLPLFQQGLRISATLSNVAPSQIVA